MFLVICLCVPVVKDYPKESTHEKWTLETEMRSLTPLHFEISFTKQHEKVRMAENGEKKMLSKPLTTRD